MPKKVPTGSGSLVDNDQSGSDSPKQDLQNSREIAVFLKSEKKRFELLQREPKLLILGTSDSGKSTLLKQLKILHGGGVSKEELEAGRVSIRQSIVDTCKIALAVRAARNQTIPKEFKSLVPSDIDDESSIPVSCLSIMDDIDIENNLPLALKLYEDEDIKKTIISLTDSAIPASNLYFMDNISRIMDKDYRPTNEDILQIRTVTPNISETVFTIKSTVFHFYDVSGLKHHRKYWISYFEGVTSILFVVDISSYDQMMAEDVHTNRMQDALTVFDFIVNHPLLKQPSIIVLFNKMDKFKSKAKTVDIKKYFPDYDGREKSVSNGFKYFQTRFKNVIKGERIVDFHPTCATDTDTMRVLIQSMIKGIIEKNLNTVGLYP